MLHEIRSYEVMRVQEEETGTRRASLVSGCHRDPKRSVRQRIDGGKRCRSKVPELRDKSSALRTCYIVKVYRIRTRENRPSGDVSYLKGNQLRFGIGTRLDKSPALRYSKLRKCVSRLYGLGSDRRPARVEAQSGFASTAVAGGRPGERTVTERKRAVAAARAA